MKKLFLKLLFIYFCIPVVSELSAQTTYSLIKNVTLNAVKNGNTTTYSWSDNSAWSPAVPLIPHGAGEIIVPQGVILTIAGQYMFDGTITVENGGSIIFDRAQPNEGELIMNSSSQIIMQSGSSISSTGPADQNKNYLQIGPSRIDGGEINNLPSPPFILDESYVSCMDLNGVAACAPTPQPVTLLYFNAKASQQSVEINWASSKAWDFSHYELERSADGLAFDLVATIEAEEFSNETIEYSYSDRQPLFGTSYYRLKAVDIDGSFEYKEMAAVKFGAESFKVYPNPSTEGFINVNWSHAEDGARVILRDNSGRSIRSVILNKNSGSISTEGLVAGIYLLSVQSPSGQKNVQVLIQ